MSIFRRSSGSLFEMLGRRTAGAHPGSRGTPARSGTTVQTPPRTPRPPFQGRLAALEKVLDGWLEVDGDPILVIDDELDVRALEAELAATPEGAESSSFAIGVDTAVVAGVVLTVVVAIAYLAGRTTIHPDAASPVAETPRAIATAPEPAIATARTEPSRPQAPREERPAEPAHPVEPAREAGAARTAHPGNFELQLVSTSDEKARAVVDFLNKAPASPLAGRTDLEAFSTKLGRSGICAVRIRGFAQKDEKLLSVVHAMRDPTGGGTFASAVYYGAKKDAR